MSARAMIDLFQSTPPARGATARFTSLRTYPVISIHAPREGGDDPPGVPAVGADISIHAPREGGDGAAAKGYPEMDYFNPRPPRGGRLQLVQQRANIGIISIHAPREGGDCVDCCYWWREGDEFQSTPPARGGTRIIQRAIFQQPFQSTPPARGATSRGCFSGFCRGYFNPRPPARGATLNGISIYGCKLIISIHAPREGGDADLHMIHDCFMYFNPRPPRGGRPKMLTLLRTDGKISIHAPREGGDNKPEIYMCTTNNFNPRPPRGGRPKRGQRTTYPVPFQSTPPARGATAGLWFWCLWHEFQSTPPARGATTQVT